VWYFVHPCDIVNIYLVCSVDVGSVGQTTYQFSCLVILYIFVHVYSTKSTRVCSV
jgi:hypothetical protein